MDAKNEDSGGSDSLDKTLQQKCKMDDVLQTDTNSNTTTIELTTDKQNELTASSTNTVITERNEKSDIAGASSVACFNDRDKYGGDAGDRVDSETKNSYSKSPKTDTRYAMGNGINAAATAAREASLRFFKASSTITNTIFSREENENNVTGISRNYNNNNDSSSIHMINSLSRNSDSHSGNGHDNINTNYRVSDRGDGNDTNDSCNIETTMKQISQNLQKTTLETSKTMQVINSASTLITAISRNTTETTLSSSSSLNYVSTTTVDPTLIILRNNSGCMEDKPGTSNSISLIKSVPKLNLTTTNITDDTYATKISTKSTTINDTINDESGDSRSKKVRFHPDVKENDGGNRVIPKKKKKFRIQTNDGDSSTYSVGGKSVDGTQTAEMDLDETGEETISEDEEEIDMQHIINEADEYIKANPIEFIPFVSCDKNKENERRVLPPSGLMSEEDLIASDDEDSEIKVNKDMELMKPENGVAGLFAKRIVNGEYSYLLSFTNQPGLYWKDADFINKTCPELLNTYEKIRQNHEEHLMAYITKRLNLRQRYTDF